LQRNPKNQQNQQPQHHLVDMDQFLGRSVARPLDLTEDDNSDLTSLDDQTPTFPGDEAPQLKAIENAADEAVAALAYARFPKEHRKRIRGIDYVLYDPYRPKKAKKSGWYWDRKQAIELVRVTGGKLLFIKYILKLYSNKKHRYRQSRGLSTWSKVLVLPTL
jgi:hypothetical protein